MAIDFDKVFDKFRADLDKFYTQLSAFEVSSSTYVARGADDKARTRFTVAPYDATSLPERATTPLTPLRQLLHYEQIMTSIEDILAWVASIDPAQFSSTISETSRTMIFVAQKDVLRSGNETLDAIVAETNHLIARVQDYAQVLQCINDAIAARKIGPIVAKLARHFIPLMKPPIARGICAKLNDLATSMLGSVRIPLDPRELIYDQLVTVGTFVPIARYENFSDLFEQFGARFQRESLRAYFDVDAITRACQEVARLREINVIFISKITAPGNMIIDFDERPLLDAEFIAAHDLEVPQFTGICERIIARFNTLRIAMNRAKTRDKRDNDRSTIIIASPGATSRDTERTNVARPAIVAHTYALLIETIDGITARVMGNKMRIIEEHFVPMESVQFLLDGQSTEQEDYNDTISRELARHIETSGVARSVNKYVSVDETDEQKKLSDRMRANLESWVRNYFSSAREKESEDQETMCANIIRAMIDRELWNMIHGMLRARYLSIAHGIARQLSDIMLHSGSAAIREMDTSARAIAINDMLDRLEIQERCAKIVSLYAILERSVART